MNDRDEGRRQSYYSMEPTGRKRETMDDFRQKRNTINLSKVSFSGDGSFAASSSKNVSMMSKAELTLLSISTKKSIESLGFSKAPSMSSYKEKHDRGRKLMMKGRNPLTLPRNTEMWHFYKESSLRTDLVGKGRDVFGLVKDIDDTRKMRLDDGKGKLKLMHGSQHSPFLEKIPDKFRFVANMKVDMETEDRINFGNLVCLMNTQDEVLCIDNQNHLYVKHLDDIGNNERIAFKVVDLNDLENSKSVEMGQQLWLLISRMEDEEASSLAKSTLLGTKVIGPPVLGKLTMQDNAEVDDSGLEKPLQGKMSAGNEDDKFRLEYNVKLQDTCYGPGSVPSATHSLKKRSQVENGGWAASGKLMGGANVPTKGSGSGSGSEADNQADTRAGYGADIHNPDHKIQKEKDDRTAEIVGGLQAVRVVNYKLFEGEDGTMEESSSTRYIGKESYNMGKWTCYHAGNDEPEDPQYLNTLTDVYLQQDLYCLSSEPNLSHWPQRALEEVEESPDEQVEHQKYIAKIQKRVDAINAAKEGEEELKRMDEQRKIDIYEQAKAEVLKNYSESSSKVMEQLIEEEIERIEKESLYIPSVNPDGDVTCSSDAETHPVTSNTAAIHPTSHGSSRVSTARRASKLNIPSKIPSIKEGTKDKGERKDGKEHVTIGTVDGTVEEKSRDSSPLTIEGMHQEVEKRIKLEQENNSHKSVSTRRPESGCVRRIVNRVPPYPYKIEQKCVWRFCLVDTAKSKDGTDLKNANAAAMTDPNNVLLKAKYTLGDSKLCRLGGRKNYIVKHLIPNDIKQAHREKKRMEREARQTNSPPTLKLENNEDEFVDAILDREEFIPGGGKFTLALNMAVSQHSFKLECNRLSDRREKEKELMKTFKSLYPSTRKLLEGKSSSGRADDSTDDNISAYSESQFDDMSQSTLETNMDDSLSIQSLSSSPTHMSPGVDSTGRNSIHNNNNNNNNNRSSFLTDLQNTHNGHRNRTNSFYGKEKAKHSSNHHGHGTSHSDKDQRMTKIEWNSKKTYEKHLEKVKSLPTMKDLYYKEPSEKPGLDEYGRELISLHTELAASNIKRGQELSNVRKNLVQLEREAQMNAQLHEKHHKKLKMFEDCDVLISQALTHKDRMEKYQKLQGLLEDEMMDEEDELKLSGK